MEGERSDKKTDRRMVIVKFGFEGMVYGKPVHVDQPEIIESRDEDAKEVIAGSEKDQDKAMPTDSKSATEDKC